MLDRIYCAEEERQRADKGLRLNGFTPDNSFKLPKAKPTLKIKRLVNPSPKIKSASSSNLQRQLLEGKERGHHGYGFSGHESFAEHIASCEICRQVAQMETQRASKGLRLLTGT